ncbi:uncharacterized protein LOC130430311 isoform X3 [Triplophysa dalaica]|uniref:uncharacterized protein LOC130430311 isoform X3 n=1 Tax=Triplophysa dalaica TaxID=1582913 RepID=UPI0024DF9347|nr:uncharacterized protein LOC130430311 isoform X3 [Triplophysa dalaica]
MFHTLLVLCFCSCLIGLFGDEVKSVSVMEGESVTLHTDVTHRQTHVEIEWRFGVNGPVIARIKRSVNINPTYNETIEIFRERLKMNNQTGDLTITNITSQHSGLYRINIPGEQKDTIKRFNLTVNENTQTHVNNNNNNHNKLQIRLVKTRSRMLIQHSTNNMHRTDEVKKRMMWCMQVWSQDADHSLKYKECYHHSYYEFVY